MAHYRKIDARIWNDEKFATLSDRAQLAFLFLLTHPNLTSLGTLRSTIPGLASELSSKHHTPNPQAFLKGFDLGLHEAYMEAFREAFGKGLFRYDERACLVWLPNFIKYNGPESPNVVRGWKFSLDLIPECELRILIIQRLKDFLEGFHEAFIKAFGEALSKPLAKTMPNHKHKHKQDIRSKQSATQIVSSEQKNSEAPATNGKLPVLLTLPLNTGKEYPITGEMVREWVALYPAVNVEQELRNMRGWLLANLKNRKTQNGILRFCSTWLKREQDKAPRALAATASASRGHTRDASALAQQRREQRQSNRGDS